MYTSTAFVEVDWFKSKFRLDTVKSLMIIFTIGTSNTISPRRAHKSPRGASLQFKYSLHKNFS